MTNELMTTLRTTRLIIVPLMVAMLIKRVLIATGSSAGCDCSSPTQMRTSKVQVEVKAKTETFFGPDYINRRSTKHHIVGPQNLRQREN